MLPSRGSASSLAEIDVIPPASQVCGEQAAGQATADKNKLNWHQGILNRGLRGYYGDSNSADGALLKTHLTATQRRGTPSRNSSVCPPRARLGRRGLRQIVNTNPLIAFGATFSGFARGRGF